MTLGHSLVIEGIYLEDVPLTCFDGAHRLDLEQCQAANGGLMHVYEALTTKERMA
jgi:hypothetical protein